jgi:lipopolysaccharide/colanic/teichoic acid biosynthesis glycosyltransferase
MTTLIDPTRPPVPRKDFAYLSERESQWQPLRPWYYPCKCAAEFLAALLMMVVAAPVILVAALLVQLTSRGPAFYSQTRVGRFGRPFTIYKLRSMTHNCERLSGAQWSKPGDARVTPFGRFLRWSHIDELPQLWNVLRGDMSLVGPRPERPEFVPQLDQVIPHYADRLLVKPGLTGLAQVQLPPDTDLASVRRKLSYDLYYCRHMSPWLDLAICLCTPLYIFKLPRWIGVKLFLVPHPEVVEDAYERAAVEPPAERGQLQPALASS